MTTNDWMWAILLLTPLVIGVLVFVFVRHALRFSRAQVATRLSQIVESYRLAYDTDPTGKPRVMVHFDVSSGETFSFEFAPPYAYVLSNELCKVAVQHGPRATVSPSDTIDHRLNGDSE